MFCILLTRCKRCLLPGESTPHSSTSCLDAPRRCCQATAGQRSVLPSSRRRAASSPAQPPPSSASPPRPGPRPRGSGQAAVGQVPAHWSVLPVSSNQVRSGQVRSDQVRSGQVRSGLVRSGQVRSQTFNARVRSEGGAEAGGDSDCPPVSQQSLAYLGYQTLNTTCNWRSGLDFYTLWREDMVWSLVFYCISKT